MIIMETWRLAFGAVFFLAAIACLVVAIRSALCKGPLLSHAWTYATPEQREKMDKKAEYHGVAIVFGGMAVAIFFMGLHILTEREWQFWLGLAAAIIAVWLGMMGGWKRFKKENPDGKLF